MYISVTLTLASYSLTGPIKQLIYVDANVTFSPCRNKKVSNLTLHGIS